MNSNSIFTRRHAGADAAAFQRVGGGITGGGAVEHADIVSTRFERVPHADGHVAVGNIRTIGRRDDILPSVG